MKLFTMVVRLEKATMAVQTEDDPSDEAEDDTDPPFVPPQASASNTTSSSIRVRPKLDSRPSQAPGGAEFVSNSPKVLITFLFSVPSAHCFVF